MEIVFPRLFFTGNRLLGERVENVSRTLGDLRGIFADVDAFSRMPQNMPAYEVSSFLPEQEGTPGGLYFGITYLHPGKVGNEYFMTKGHFHANIDRAEFYWGVDFDGPVASSVGRTGFSREPTLYTGWCGSPYGKYGKYFIFFCSLLAV